MKRRDFLMTSAAAALAPALSAIGTPVPVVAGVDVARCPATMVVAAFYFDGNTFVRLPADASGGKSA